MKTTETFQNDSTHFENKKTYSNNVMSSGFSNFIEYSNGNGMNNFTKLPQSATLMSNIDCNFTISSTSHHNLQQTEVSYFDNLHGYVSINNSNSSQSSSSLQ